MKYYVPFKLKRVFMVGPYSIRDLTILVGVTLVTFKYVMLSQLLINFMVLIYVLFVRINEKTILHHVIIALKFIFSKKNYSMKNIYKKGGQMKITDLINFHIKDDFVKTNSGDYHFYKIIPPNLSILSEREIQSHISCFYLLLKALPCDLELQIFMIDRSEDLSKNKEYWTDVPTKFIDISNEIISDISKNRNQNGVQRGFYFVINPTNDTQVQSFEKALKSSSFIYLKQQQNDIIGIFRSFLLRDFKDFDLQVFNDETVIDYDNLKSRKKKKLSKETFTLNSLTKALLPTNLNFKKLYIEQSDFLRQVMIIKNFPMSFETSALLKDVATLKDVTINMRISEMNNATAMGLVDNQIKSAENDSFTKQGVKQMNAESEYSEVTAFYKKYSADRDTLFYVNIYIETYGKDELELELIKTQVNAMLDTCSIEVLSWEQTDGFLGVCPITKDKLSILSNNIPSKSLSAMYPFTYSTRNDNEGLYLGHTVDGGYMFLDFFKRTDDLTNGNFSLIGGSGMGKSHIMKKIINQLAMKNRSLFIFDQDSEYVDLINNIGGTNINATSSSFRINPFEIRKFVKPDDLEINEFKIEAFNTTNDFLNHLSWLRDFIKYIIPHATGIRLDMLMSLIKETYQSLNINEDTDLSQLSNTDYPIFSDLYSTTQKIIAKKKDYEFFKKFNDDAISDCLLLINDVSNGSMSLMFNGYTNLPNADIINFNIQDLATGDSNRTQAYMFNVFTYLNSRMFAKTKQFAILIDELALLCNTDNVKALQYLKTIMQRIRKYEGILGTATQQLLDLMIPEFKPYTSALYNLSSIKFILNPGEIDLNSFKSFANFEDERLDSLIKFKKGECYLFVGTHDKYKVKINKLPYEGTWYGKAGGR